MMHSTQTIIPPLLYGTAWKKDKTCDVEHMQEDLNIFDFELNNEEREMIDQLLL